MSALAELLKERGALVSGSDTGEVFYTDQILRRLEIPVYEDFDPSHIDGDLQLVVHSAAYNRETHDELVKAAELGIPVLNYPETLGELSSLYDSSGVSGVHGKSTTTAIIGTLVQELDVPASIIAGTAVPTFGDRSTINLGNRFLIAESCEWRRHFHLFHPNRIIITNVELDHTDYFTSDEDILEAFVTYARRLPPGGELIYCADDPGASAVATEAARRADITITPYGHTAAGPFRIRDMRVEEGKILFGIGAIDEELELRIPGKHNVQNAVAGVALLWSIIEKTRGKVANKDIEGIIRGLKRFKGSRRRSQIVGERNGVLFVDDYGHHPTAIRKTLAGYRDFYPGRRIVLDFMSHTYTRTQDLFQEFVSSFDDADVVLLHRIYASAREREGRVTGKDLYDAVRERRGGVHYYHEVMDAYPFCLDLLVPGDLFITMGAGDNWRLGAALAALSEV